MLNLYEAARRRSVPILVVRTSDQMMTVETLMEFSGGKDDAIVQWDAAQGMTSLNKLGKDALAKLKITPESTLGFVDAMIRANELPQNTVIVALNAHRQLQSGEPIAIAAAVQSVANLRDQFKRNFRMLVLLGPSFVLPTELEQDVIIIDHALPNADELKAVITSMYKSAQQEVPTDGTLEKGVEATCGLSSFAAEQVTAMSFSVHGLDIDALWERKRLMIEQTDGLSVYRGSETLDDLRGLASVKARLRSHIKAKTPIGVVVWIDSN